MDDSQTKQVVVGAEAAPTVDGLAGKIQTAHESKY
jgi:hypothetical protein